MTEFEAPQSRNEAILQNILGAENVLPEPQSRIEAYLQAILEQGGGLPKVTSNDNGKVLRVVDGQWTADGNNFSFRYDKLPNGTVTCNVGYYNIKNAIDSGKVIKPEILIYNSQAGSGYGYLLGNTDYGLTFLFIIPFETTGNQKHVLIEKVVHQPYQNTISCEEYDIIL